jgi:hypothetical protein
MAGCSALDADGSVELDIFSFLLAEVPAGGRLPAKIGSGINSLQSSSAFPAFARLEISSIHLSCIGF